MVPWVASWSPLPSDSPHTAAHRVQHLSASHANSSSGVDAPLSVSALGGLQACPYADGVEAPSGLLLGQ